MKKITLWCAQCKQVEVKTVDDKCPVCNKYRYRYIEQDPIYPLPEDIYAGLRSLIRADYIGDIELQAIKALCLYGLGEARAPSAYYEETIPFETKIPPQYRIRSDD